MAIPSGLSGQVGYAAESTYGTGVTVTRFVPFVSESLALTRERKESAGIIAGRRVITSDQWNGGNDTIGGDVAHEIYTTQIGLLLTHMFGSVATTGSGPYVHTYTPGTLLGKSLTVQVGRPDSSGTVRPFTYTGMKVASWALGCAAGEIATLGLTFVGQAETTATALASASFPSGAGVPLKFNHASVDLDGSAVLVKTVTINGDNALATDRRFLGSATVSEPLEMDRRTYSGTLDMEFADMDAYTIFQDGDEVALVLAFTAGDDSLEITMNVRIDSAPTNVAGMGVLGQTVGFKAIASSTDASAITAVYTTADSTP